MTLLRLPLRTLIFTQCLLVMEELPGGVDYTDSNQYISSESASGLIYYSGTMIPPDSYNARMEELSRSRDLAVTAHMPLNPAVLVVSAAIRIRNKCSGIGHWIIGSHLCENAAK